MSFTKRVSVPTLPAVSNDQLVEWLRIDADTDQTTLDLLLGSATDYIETITGQTLLSADYQVFFDCWGDILTIPLFPLNSVASVSTLNADGTTTALDASQYTLNINSCSPYIVLNDCFPDAVQIIVAANAGYVTQPSIPQALLHAAIVLVGAGYDERDGYSPTTLTTVDRLVSRYRRAFL